MLRGSDCNGKAVECGDHAGICPNLNFVPYQPCIIGKVIKPLPLNITTSPPLINFLLIKWENMN